MRETVSLLLIACATIAAQTPTPGIADAMRKLVDNPALGNGRVGVHVRDLANGTVLAQHDDDKGFMTASNMKLFSSATALLTLGPDFRFVTRLEVHGVVHDGLVDGDLVLVGAGDPTLGGRHETLGPRAPFLRMARCLREEHGIQEVTGAVLGDDDCQPDEVMGEGWSWGYEAADYAAQVSGLCFAENVVRIEFLANQDGQHAALRLSPETEYLHLDDQVRVGGDRTDIELARARGSNQVTLRGKLGSGKKHGDAVSVDNPSRFAAHVLRECLLEAGIRVRGPAADRDEWSAAVATTSKTLCEHRSPPLRATLHTLNKVSQNLYAEQLVRAAARVARGQADMSAAATHAASILRTLGGDPRGLVLADGSGLTRLNLVQPRQIADLLAGMWKHEHRDLFVDTLPIAGVDGTLANRMQDGAARGHVHAKTGFISRVVALSGYVMRSEPDTPIVFSILVNNFTCDTQTTKDAVDAFVQDLARFAGW